MIEQLPEIEQLTDNQKFELATELWAQVSTSETLTPDPSIVDMLQERYAAFKSGLHSATPWESIKRRIGK